MSKTPETFSIPDMLTIMMNTGTKRPKTDVETTYLKKNNIDEAISQIIRKRDVYKTNMQNIYNLIVGHTNEQVQ